MAILEVNSLSGDGYVYNYGANFSECYNATIGDGNSDTGTYFRAKNQSISDSDYRIERTFLPFNTTTLPVGLAVTSAYLRLRTYRFGDGRFSNEKICIVNSNQTDVNSLENLDYGRLENQIGGNLSISDIGTSYGYRNITFNSTGLSFIKRGDYTKIGLRFESEINASWAANALLIRSSEDATEAYRPLLHTEYADLSSTLNLTSIITASVNLESFSKILNLTSSIQSQFKYYLTHQLNLTSQIEADKEADFALTDEILPIPPRFKLLGYTVIQEYGTPYYTAELKFQGDEIPPKDEYITLYQTDAETKQKKIIFRGFPLSVSWTLKKDLSEANVKAVTNGWYLTKQCIPKDECTTPEYWAINWYRNGRSFKYYYPRMNELMLIWDWLNFIPSERDYPSYWENLNMAIETRPTGFCSFYSDWSAKKAAIRWKTLTGVAPSYEMAQSIQNIMSTYMDASYSDIPDCKGNVSWDAKYWETWNDFDTKKWDAIEEMADWCNYVFHSRIAQSDSDLRRKQTPGGYYNRGTQVAYWTNATIANDTNGAIEPFNVLLDINASLGINASGDNTFLIAHKEVRTTERTLPNIVQVRSQEQSFWNIGDKDDYYNDGESPCEWWQRASGKIDCGAYWWQAKPPIIHYKKVAELDEEGVEDYADEYYERLQLGEDKFSASFLSTICERNGSSGGGYRCILPGSQIRLKGVANHTSDIMRITKIIHRKDGAKPAMTDIEYCKIYDLAHPHIIETGIMDRILADFERKAIKGTREETYQNIYNPRKPSFGNPVYAELGKVKNVSNDIVDVILLNTSTIIKDVMSF